ncbi:MAG: CHAT domain-containing protein [Kineosporiaceae bacterium]
MERSRRAADHEAHVVALRAQAWAAHCLLGNHTALRHLDLAVRIAVRHGLDERLAEVLASRAAVNQELGRVVAAHHDLDRAAALPGGPRHQVLFQQAVLHHNQGRLTAAEATYRRVLAEPGCPDDIRVKMSNNLGHLLAECGRPGQALHHVDEAAGVARTLGPALVAGVEQTRAWVLMQAGRLSESLRAFEDAEKLFDESGLPTADFSLEYADALVDLRLVREAIEVTERAVGEFLRHGAGLMAAEAQLRRARLSALAGDPASGAPHLEDALASLRRQRRTAWVAGAMVTRAELRLALGTATARDLTGLRRAAENLERLHLSSAVEANLVLGRLAASLGRPAAALRAWRRAHDLTRGTSVLIRLRGRVAAALAADLEGSPTDVLRHCRAGLDDLGRHRAALSSMELRALASGHGEDLGRLGARALLPTGSAPRLLAWLERTRAAALVMVDPPAPARMQEDLANLRALEVQMREARRAEGREPHELQVRAGALEARIRRASWLSSSPSLGPGASQAVRRPAGLRRMLAGATLVEYTVLDGEVVAVVLGPRRTGLIRLCRYQAVLDEREALRFALRRLTRPGRHALSAVGVSLDRLADLLVRPLGLPPDVPLVVAPARGLNGVTWSALHPAPVSLAPSAALWARTRVQATDDRSEVVLVAGPDLPGALAEVRALAAVHAAHGVAARTLVAERSTVDAVTDELAGAGIAHLACHGFLRTDNPAFSALHLADGPLTVHELSLHGRPAHRIVLAACRSGAQMTYAGEEVLGFVSALLARGTAGVVAATVPVPDGESVPLMRALHEHLARGSTLAEALHAARSSAGQSPADFIDRPVDLMAWCAYTAYGAA